MMRKYLFFFLFALVILFCTLFVSNQIAQKIPTKLHSQKEIKVAFIADQGLGTSSRAVLSLIKQEHAELILHQGDFDYHDNPEAWDKQTTEILGARFPQLAVIGNHDMKMRVQYETKIEDRILDNPLFTCSGKLGEQANCIYKNLNIVSISPGLTPGDPSAFIESSFATPGDNWKICSWHLDQADLQVGDKTNEAGWAAYQSCLNAGAIIATAHEHSYERTFLLDAVSPPHVSDASSTLALAPGKTFVFVSGLGGESIRPQKQHADYWASVYTSDQGANYGALFCTFNIGGDTHKARCYFKDIAGITADRFTITR